MSGASVTKGLSAKRVSSLASGTSNSLSSRMAWAQNATSRDVSDIPGKPNLALNHWRSLSTRLISEMGTLQTRDATLISASNSSSGPLSKMSSPCKAANLSASVADNSAGCMEKSFHSVSRNLIQDRYLLYAFRTLRGHSLLQPNQCQWGRVRINAYGSLAERFKAPVLKTGEDVSPP